MSSPIPLTITVTTDAQKSNACRMRDGNNGFLLHVPTLENATDIVRLEVYTNSTQPTQADNAALAANINTDWVEMDLDLAVGGPQVAPVGANIAAAGCWVRVVVDVAQAADRVFGLIECTR
jgi:hypothetical protein